MDPTIVATAALTAGGALIKMLLPLFRKKPKQVEYIQLGEKNKETPESPQSAELVPNAKKFLLAFVIIVATFGLVTLIRYWDAISRNQDSFYFVIWLFIFMVLGMFVQVVSYNYRAGKGLLQVTVSQLVFPLLFSVVVFYPIWALAASASPSFFSIHAAFLNGYFWESVVSTASPPKPVV